MVETSDFTYWEYPYQKKLALFVTILLAFIYGHEFYEFYLISRPEVRTELFSQLQWQNYSAEHYFMFAAKLGILLVSSGSILTGSFAKTEKTARKYDGLCSIGMILYWCVVGAVLNSGFDSVDFIFWLILLLALLSQAISSFRKSQKL